MHRAPLIGPEKGLTTKFHEEARRIERKKRKSGDQETRMWISGKQEIRRHGPLLIGPEEGLTTKFHEEARRIIRHGLTPIYTVFD